MTKHFGTMGSIGLRGLSESEEFEFKKLSKVKPAASESESRIRDARWIELYLKRETARLLAADLPSREKS